MSSLHFVYTLAETATSPGPAKWEANTQLISWFRSDPVAILRALRAAEHVLTNPGYLANLYLHQSMQALPRVQDVENE